MNTGIVSVMTNKIKIKVSIDICGSALSLFFDQHTLTFPF